MALLEVKNLGISFGGLRAVDEFSITIEKVSSMVLLGRTEQERPLSSICSQAFISQQTAQSFLTERTSQAKALSR